MGEDSQVVGKGKGEESSGSKLAGTRIGILSFDHHPGESPFIITCTISSHLEWQEFSLNYLIFFLNTGDFSTIEIYQGRRYFKIC